MAACVTELVSIMRFCGLLHKKSWTWWEKNRKAERRIELVSNGLIESTVLVTRREGGILG